MGDPDLYNYQSPFIELMTAITDGNYDRVKKTLKSYKTSTFSPIISQFRFCEMIGTAIKYKYPLITKLILKRFPRISIQSKNIKVWIRLSIVNSDIETLKVLLGEGADFMKYITKQSFETDFSALHYVAQKENLEIAKLLIRKGANVNARNHENKTPLHVAACDSPSVVKYLIEKGGDVNARDNCGQTPLHFAASKRNAECLHLLLANGADIRRVDYYSGQTTLHRAARGSPEILKLILNLEVFDVNVRDNIGLTPLHLAVQQSLKNTEILLAHKANINAETVSGGTPLYFAISRGYRNIINYLISQGADFMSKTTDGMSIAELTMLLGYHDILSRLLILGFNINSLIGDDSTRVERLIWQTRGILVKEIALAAAQNQFVHGRFFEEIMKNEKMALEYETCEKELQCMMAEKFEDTTISVFDICTKNFDQLVGYLRNDKVAGALKCNDFYVKFPKYADKIIDQLKIGKETKLMQEKCTKNCYFAFSQLPVVNFEKILSFLSNTDMLNLIEACKPTKNKL